LVADDADDFACDYHVAGHQLWRLRANASRASAEPVIRVVPASPRRRGRLVAPFERMWRATPLPAIGCSLTLACCFFPPAEVMVNFTMPSSSTVTRKPYLAP